MNSGTVHRQVHSHALPVLRDPTEPLLMAACVLRHDQSPLSPVPGALCHHCVSEKFRKPEGDRDLLVLRLIRGSERLA